MPEFFSHAKALSTKKNRCGSIGQNFDRIRQNQNGNSSGMRKIHTSITITENGKPMRMKSQNV